MEDMDFGQPSIDEMTKTSSDETTETSIDASHQTSIDDTPPEAGKFSLTNHVNEEVVLGEPKGQLSNAINQIINEQGTAIPVQINSISKRDEETKLPLQDYLNPGRTYSNSSAIKLPKDDTKRFRLSLEHLILVRQNPFCGTISEHPHDQLGRSPNWTWSSSANGRAESVFDPTRPFAELNSTDDLARSVRRIDH
ncbi:hypothetical protein DY000_02039719 [Brassica cretica]|uniref:Uncharacterized protein n=1 Tax=Brassica cretica TaxID=69181 RepID=A0ABQ7B572_BRACR|nr:hypothetical protein DY000_02039719 [Brassica cretica]